MISPVCFLAFLRFHEDTFCALCVGLSVSVSGGALSMCASAVRGLIMKFVLIFLRSTEILSDYYFRFFPS